MRHYYEAYDERYKTAHGKGVSWSSDTATPIVLETIEKYISDPQCEMLELGCGEGRDAKALLERGYRLLATDLSGEAIAYCREKLPRWADRFQRLDCVGGELAGQFGFVYAVAVVHMLVADEDRNAFYRFLRAHLREDGVGLICTMGDGTFERASDPAEAFELREREHETGTMMVAATTCRMVSFPTFEAELRQNRLRIEDTGITASPPDFNSLMYAVVRRD